MTSFEFIEKQANRLQTSTLNIAREFIQLKFLQGFYEQKESKNLFFKGGTALRLVHGSPRFSEDLDFSAVSQWNCTSFEKLLQEGLCGIELSGIKAELVESKSTTGGCLGIFTVSFDRYRFNIQLEVSLRNYKSIYGNTLAIR